MILPPPYPGFSIPKRKKNFIIDIFLLCHHIVNLKRENQKHFSFIAIRFGQLLKWGSKYYNVMIQWLYNIILFSINMQATSNRGK